MTRDEKKVQENRIAELTAKNELLERVVIDLKSSFDEVLGTLAKLAETISLEFELKEVLEIIFQLVGKVVDYTFCAILLYNDKNDIFRIEATRGGTNNSSLFVRLKDLINDGLVSWAVQKRNPIIVPNIAEEDNLSLDDAPPPGSSIIVPLIANNRPIAVIVVETAKSEGDYRGQDLSLLAIMASQAAVAINNAFLYEEMGEKNLNLERMQTYMRNVYESMTSGLVVLNMKGVVKTFSRPAENLIGVEASEAEGKHYKEVFEPRLAFKLDNLVIDTLADGRAIDFELDDMVTGAKGVPIGFSTSLLRQEQGLISGIIILCHDISQTMELEELKRLDRLKSELISNVSHELRTPLSSIKAYTENSIALLETGNSETLKEFLEVVSEETDRLTRLIGNLLDLSRIEAGRLVLEPSEYDLGQILEKVVAVVRPWARERGVFLVSELEGGVILKGDSEKTAQVAMNLLSNAIKYNRDGGTTSVRSGIEGGMAFFEVSDSGIGIPEKDLPHIFDKFYRGDSSLTSHVSGTGLGLAIVKNIIEMHGGTIDVTSTHGEGAVFMVRLPLEVE